MALSLVTCLVALLVLVVIVAIFAVSHGGGGLVKIAIPHVYLHCCSCYDN